MLALVAPTARLHRSWLEARAEWAPGEMLHGHGVDPDRELESADGFAAWVASLLIQSDESIPVVPERVHATYWWIVQGDTFLGSINLRHRLNEALLRGGGHIGYGLRPSARGRRLASWALGEVLPIARSKGLERVLLTCQDGNAASARTIERNGGVLEDVAETQYGLTRRYWIALA